MEKLSPDEIRRLLAKKERWVALTTIGPNGFPHTVPIGYFLVGEKIVMGCRDATQKVKNIERDDRVSIMWENGKGKDSLSGILLQGYARLIRDQGERLEYKRIACEQRGLSRPTPLTPGAIYIEMTPCKTISWYRPTGRKK
jgi:nitroimidazol reductase NimA-like FMN-containing flavoprotein (pyridoxamine 5'-phosphate oxidase superfamily)